MKQLVFRTGSEEETMRAGAELARRLPRRAVVILSGNLGAGKTTLVKGVVAGLGAAEPSDVSSPTFTLVHEYGEPPRVFHVDLYRIDDARQLASIGIEELIERDGLTLVEWGEKFRHNLPRDAISVSIGFEGATGRRIEVSGLPGIGGTSLDQTS